MSGLDFTVHGLADAGGGVMIPQLGRDDQSYVEFFKGERHSKFQSDAAGVPVYVPIDMVRVIQPGEKDINCQEVKPLHKMRWPRQWEAYQQGQSQVDAGTPLEMLFPGSPATVNELKSMHVYNVQQLANLSDTAMNGIGMGRTLSQKAKAYLEQASGGGAFHAMQQQMEKLQRDLAAAVDTITVLQAQKYDPSLVPAARSVEDEDARRDIEESRAASRSAKGRT